jgi:hypothetical protein
LQEYFGFTPSFSHAVFKGVPSGMSIFFPFDVNTVMRRGERELIDEELDELLLCASLRKACVDPKSAVNNRSADIINENLDILFFVLEGR